MKILITRPIEERIARRGLGASVAYRPELASRPDQFLPVLHEHRPEVLVAQEVEESWVAPWREISGRKPIAIVGGNGAAAARGWLTRYGIELLGPPPEGGAGDLDLAALRQAEGFINHHSVRPALAAAGLSERPAGGPSGQRVLLAGAGIVNLLTAYELIREGYRVTILEGSAPPWSNPDWRLLGATRGGGNARMFCLTEADNYNDKGSVLYSDMKSVLRRRISEGGWLAGDPDRLPPSTRRWIDLFSSVPPWLADIFTQDIYTVNRQSMNLWAEIRAGEPGLFADVGYVEGVLRIYYEEEAFAAASDLQRRVGAVRGELLSRDQVAVRHPALAKACANGQIAGGMEVIGFTVNIHDFVARFEEYLAERGVEFLWNTRIDGIARDAEGRIEGLRTAKGLERADHYVVSPGAYGRDCLCGTRTEGKIEGVVGLWLTLPNLEPRLGNSAKLHREGHVGEDSNITLARDERGRPILLLGSGYAFLGGADLDLEHPEIAALFEALEDTARRYLPDAYAQALADGSLRRSRRACVRPFTPTGLGVLEVLGAAGGGRLVITTGHNTGGFTQAPAVARAVAATLNGSFHPMQEIYDPERGLWN